MDGCRIGVGRVRITPESPGATSGHGPYGNKNAVPPEEDDQQLYVTALALEDANDERVVFVNADLWCGSSHNWRAAAAAASLDPSRLVFCGTHTHAGPGQQMDGRMYALTSSSSRVKASGRRLAPLIGRAVREAIAALVPGGVDVVRTDVLGVASNRALPAWVHYSDQQRADFVEAGPGHALRDEPNEADRFRDPRLTVLVGSSDDGIQRCALGWYAVHGTALGPAWPTFGADLWGTARQAAEAKLEGDEHPDRTLVGFGGGCSGDISPLPLDPDGEIRAGSDGRPSEQGRELAEAVGTILGDRLADAVTTAEPGGFDLAVAHEMWRPRRSGLPAPIFGLGQFGGGIDGPTDKRVALGAGIRAPVYQAKQRWGFLTARAQRPKLNWLLAYLPVPIPLVLEVLFSLIGPRRLPLHVIRVADHTFATVPGEPTTMSGWRIEQAVADVAGTGSTSVIGFAGDYGGYWVTAEEFMEQRYEAASTLFGRESAAKLTNRLTDLARQLS